MGNKNIVILGGGESGVGAAILAKKLGYNVFLSDKGIINPSYISVLEAHQIDFESNKHSEDIIFQADEIIKSPGIPDTVPLIQTLIDKKIPLISEIEFAARHTDKPIIAITGTNGKTTTTTMIYQLLKSTGNRVGLGGNIGDSFAKQVAEEDKVDFWVLELSSFQLDHCFQFHPHIAIILNITADHLDRYDFKMNKYIASKFRITQSMGEEDHVIYNEESKEIKNYLSQNPLKSTLIPVTLNESHQNKLLSLYGTQSYTIPTKDLSFSGKHNFFNALCAIKVGQIIGLSEDTIRQGLKSFKPVAHRFELIKEVCGVKYINDSKATNIDSVYCALESCVGKKNVVWIVGGVDKGNDYSILDQFVFDKVKFLIALGKDNSVISRYYQEKIPMKEAHSMKEAITISQEFSENGDWVLLSPGCASFDLFKNYIDRGDQFRNAVLNLDK